MAAAGALGVAAQEEKKQVKTDFTARSALFDEQTGKVLFPRMKHSEWQPASLTKLMDLLLIFQQLQSGQADHE